MVTSVSLLPGSRRRVQALPLPRAVLSRACSTRCRGGAGHEGLRLFWLFMLFHPGRTRILTQQLFLERGSGQVPGKAWPLFLPRRSRPRREHSARCLRDCDRRAFGSSGRLCASQR